MPYRKIGEQLATKEIAVGKPLRLKVSGRSMAPILKEGDTVIATPLSRDQLRVGDLLVVRRDENFVTHRLVGMQSGWLKTKGDNVRFPDPDLPYENVVGRVAGILHQDTEYSTHRLFWRLNGAIIAFLSGLTGKIYPVSHKTSLPFHVAGIPFRMIGRFVQRQP